MFCIVQHNFFMTVRLSCVLQTAAKTALNVQSILSYVQW